jgi:hypothetical protein
MDGSPDGWTDGWTDGWMGDGKMSGCMAVWMYEYLDGRKAKCMD